MFTPLTFFAKQLDKKYKPKIVRKVLMHHIYHPLGDFDLDTNGIAGLCT
jgi:hypothetical protein